MEISRYGQDLAQKALEAGKSASDNFYLTLVNNQNEQRVFKFMEAPLRNSTVGVASNITQSEQNKKDLAKYIIAHHNLLENSSSAMALYRADRRLLFYNNAFAKLWDLDRKWLDSQPRYEEILENLRDKHKLPEQADFKKFKNDQVNLFSNLLQTYHEFLHLPDSRTLRSFIIPHALGGLLFSYEDMSDRLNMIRSYNALVAVKKATLDNLSEAISVFGEDGKLKLYNHVYAEIWNLEDKFLKSNPHISTFLEHTKHLYKHKENWAKFRDYFMLQFTSRNKAYIRLQLKNNLILDVSTIPLPDGATLFTYLDVTDSFLVERSLQERNEILEKTEKLKSEFLTSISYELRSPLTSIMGFAEMLMNGYVGKLSKKQTDYINDIYLSSNQLKGLIDDVLDLVSIETGRTTLKKEGFDIYKLIGSVAALVKGLAGKLGSQINLECDNKIGSMTGDKARVKRIIYKILLKAINSSTKLNGIKLSVRKKSDNLEIGIEYREGSLSMDTNDLSGFDLNLLIADRLAKLHSGSVAFSVTPEGLSRITCKLFIGHYSSIK
jgi:PAS domain-containing protein